MSKSAVWQQQNRAANSIRTFKTPFLWWKSAQVTYIITIETILFMPIFIFILSPLSSHTFLFIWVPAAANFHIKESKKYEREAVHLEIQSVAAGQLDWPPALVIQPFFLLLFSYALCSKRTCFHCRRCSYLICYTVERKKWSMSFKWFTLIKVYIFSFRELISCFVSNSVFEQSTQSYYTLMIDYCKVLMLL